MPAESFKSHFGERLRRARTMRGLSLRALADALGDSVSHSALQKYEKGVMSPDSTTLNALACTLDIRPDFFFAKTGVTISGIEFRKRSKLSKKVEKSIEQCANEFFERYLEIENILNIEQQDWAQFDLSEATDSLDEEIENAAQELRKDWKLGAHTLPNTCELLEDHGIKTMEFETDTEFDGFSGWIDDAIPIVVVAKWLDGDLPRKRLTVLHELGHLMMKLPKDLSHKQIEAKCYQFGQALLIPKNTFIEAFGGKRKKIIFKELIAIKEEWGLSIAAIMKRANLFGLITDSHYRHFCIQNRKRGIKEPGVWTGKESTQRFETLVYQAAAKEIISRSKAAGLLRVTLTELEENLNFA